MEAIWEALFFFLLFSTLILAGTEILMAFFPIKKRSAAKAVRFSIIIAARNESRHLPELLNCVLHQNYFEYEVILVLDRCEDDSEDIAHEFAQLAPHLKIVSLSEIPESWSPKKFALFKGIENAKYEWLAFTDADCRPPAHWLQSINLSMNEHTEIVIGGSPVFKELGFLNMFIRFETMRTALYYMGLAKLGLPWMAVGRNLAYSKTLFQKTNQMAAFRHFLSGDDDLILSHYGRQGNTSVMEKSPVFTFGTKTLKNWMNQKIRHLSASQGYKKGKALLLAGLNLNHGLFYLTLLVLIFSNYQIKWVLAVWVFRIVAGWVVNKRIQSNTDILMYLAFPLLDFLLVFYHLILFPLSLVAKPKWR